MLAISIEKQRKRPPFEIVFGWRMRGGRAARARLAKRKYTKCSRLIFKSKGNAGLFWNYVWKTRLRKRKYIMVVFVFFYFECFRLVLKSKGNARFLSNLVWRTDGRGAGGRRGQACQKEIYFRIVCFYSVKCLRLVLKHKTPFLQLCLADGWAGGGRPGPH